MIDIMSWDEWINLTPAEQEAVRQRYERPDSEPLPGSAEPYREVGWLGGFDVEPTK